MRGHASAPAGRLVGERVVDGLLQVVQVLVVRTPVVLAPVLRGEAAKVVRVGEHLLPPPPPAMVPQRSGPWRGIQHARCTVTMEDMDDTKEYQTDAPSTARAEEPFQGSCLHITGSVARLAPGGLVDHVLAMLLLILPEQLIRLLVVVLLLRTAQAQLVHLPPRPISWPVKAGAEWPQTLFWTPTRVLKPG